MLLRASPALRAAEAAAPAPKVARTRPLPARKQLLYAHHAHLLQASPLVLFLRPGEFSAHEWRQIRAQLAAVPPPPPSPAPHASTSTAPAPAPAPTPAPADDGLRLTVLRPGLLPALLRDAESRLSGLDLAHLAQPSHLEGPLAVLTASSLHPPTLARVLALVRAFSRAPKPNAPPPAPGAPVDERLAVLSALVERQAADPERTVAVSKLPPLDVLRAQIVGLVSQPGSRITGVLAARAGDVARTLEGFKVGLEQQQQPQGSDGEAAAPQ
ncbi:hypothetical protein Rhopal_007049-T1 [Rhodotorula paludigena]|uniref:50S ribosomal protein L10 n=1 Tax=Rhodotorula paludigena TaxID=86838 RepID=A0AAV5GWW5_9BASI|nr:hypothetical protein Rhopal_007049-T1 [Rhodotorula paludigena]